MITLNTTLALFEESSINHRYLSNFKGDFASLRSMTKNVKLTSRVQSCDNISDKWVCFHKTIADGVNLFDPVKGKSTVINWKHG